jgi:hypothetical protein
VIMMTVSPHAVRKVFASSISSEGKTKAVLPVDLSARSFRYLTTIVLGRMVFPYSLYILLTAASPWNHASRLEMEMGHACGLANSNYARIVVSDTTNHS